MPRGDDNFGLEGLIDRIYESAAIPELWRSVLEDFARQAGLKHAILIAARGDNLRWVASAPEFEQFAADHYAFEGGPERTQRLLAIQHPGFITDRDAYTAEEMAEKPLFRDFLIPRGYGSAVGTAIPLPSGETIIVHAEGSHTLGPVGKETISRLDPLRPHFARAALLSARLELERAQSATQTLSVLGLPGAVVGGAGRAISVNERFAELVPDVFQDRALGLALANAKADALLASALAQAEVDAGAAVGSIPIPAQGERPPMVVHVLPIRGLAHDVFGSAVAVVIVTPVVPRDVPSATLIQGLFDLTPSEARLAALIAGGRQPREAAAELGCAYETVRTTLKSTMAKTGVSRQAELVGLLSAIPRR